MADKRFDVSIVIPFLNEEANIPALVEELRTFFAAHPELRFETVFVDDGSTDAGVQKLKEARLPGSRIVRLSRNFGSHAALKAGILHSTGECVSNLYADLQEPPEVIPQFRQKMKEGFDVVWGYRERSEGSWPTRLFSRLYAWLMRRFVTKNYTDTGLDFVMFNGKVRKCLNENIEANSSFVLQILSLGFKQTHIPYAKRKRERGRSKWTWGMKMKLFIDSFVAFSYFPIRAVTFTGILLALGGFAWALYIVARKLLVGDMMVGWPALVAILMLGFGVTNVSLGIIAEYLWRTLDAARRRPVFVVDEVVECEGPPPSEKS